MIRPSTTEIVNLIKFDSFFRGSRPNGTDHERGKNIAIFAFL
jgi:hypothetical protein